MKGRFDNFWLDMYDILSFLVLVAGIVLFLRFFVANPFRVVGSSMYTTFDENDIIVVDKVSSRVTENKRWDIIVFVAPGKTAPYIKRIIGLPWEIVKIKWGKVLICEDNNGDDICRELEENYLSDTVRTIARCNVAEFYVRDWFFVLGDNRGLSTDSLCCFGEWCSNGESFTVPQENIIGKVWMRLYPDARFF